MVGLEVGAGVGAFVGFTVAVGVKVGFWDLDGENVGILDGCIVGNAIMRKNVFVKVTPPQVLRKYLRVSRTPQASLT